MVEDEEDIAAFAGYEAVAATTPPPPSAEPVAAAPTPVVAAPAVAAAPPTVAAASGGRLNASPLAKAMAAEAGLALAVFAASGPNGRITRADVEVYLEELAKAPAAVVEEAVAAPAGEAVATGNWTDIPMTNVRKVCVQCDFPVSV
jgi:pyruvate dehydrogenase E2 component (dihydrolipoamide acetyltransferase)